MNKIGILTYHHNYNYGTELQAIALQYYIENKLCKECEIINYQPDDGYSGKVLIETRIRRSLHYIKHFRKYFTLFKNRYNVREKKKQFDVFLQEYMRVSPRITQKSNLVDIVSNYSTVAVGSDQTWNPLVSQWETFLLDYVQDGTKKVAYAPSLGTGEIPQGYLEIYKNSLASFSYISCREASGATFLSELLNRDVKVVLDPTMLLKKEEWLKFASPISAVKKPYLLVYMLGDNADHRRVILNIANRYNLNIVSLPISFREMLDTNGTGVYCGPGGFISLLNDADFICTDSFHGTMFSINFNKDFYAFTKFGKDETGSDNKRLFDALSMFSLEDRMYKGNEPTNRYIDYDRTNSIINTMRLEANEFLKNALCECKDMK